MEEAYQQKETPSTASRPSSPAGDDQGLDYSSRDGLSSALQGVGAGRQESTDLASGMTELINHQDDDEPPAYSKIDPNDGGLTYHVQGADNMDLDEGVDTNSSVDQVAAGPFSENTWGFDKTHTAGVTGPPASSDEDLMDGVSDKAADGSSAGNFSDREDRMADFAEDDDTGGAVLGNSFTNSPNLSGASPVAEIPIEPESDTSLHVKAPVIQGDDEDEDDDGPVAEVHVESEEGLIKSD